jgi:hypothetical protein
VEKIIVAHCADDLGRLQAKHARWAHPIAGALNAHLLQITGGTEEKPTRGVNVVLSFDAVEPTSVSGETVNSSGQASASKRGNEPHPLASGRTLERPTRRATT